MADVMGFRTVWMLPFTVSQAPSGAAQASSGGVHWVGIVTAVGSLLAGLGIVAVVAGALVARHQLNATMRQVELAAEQLNLVAKQVEEAQRSRHADIWIDMSRRWDEEALTEARMILKTLDGDELCRRYWDSAEGTGAQTVPTREHLVLQREPNYFEDLGALYSQNCITLDMIDILLGSIIVRQWRLWLKTIDKIKAGTDRTDPYPRAYEEFENLHKAILEVRISQGRPIDSPAPASK